MSKIACLAPTGTGDESKCNWLTRGGVTQVSCVGEYGLVPRERLARLTQLKPGPRRRELRPRHAGRGPRKKKMGPRYRTWACSGKRVDNLSGCGPTPSSDLSPFPCRVSDPKLTEGRTTTTPYGRTCVALDGTDLKLW